jgi:predicted helicase
MTTEPFELVYSYAHEDAKLLKKLDDALSLLQRESRITSWSDRKISAGSLWAEEIDERFKKARIILLLISNSFLASDYCYGVEMKLALERHEKGEARVIPVIMRPCDWKTAPFGKLQALPQDGRPVIKWRPQDDAFVDIARGIRRVVEKMSGTISSTEPPAAASHKRGRVAEQAMPSPRQSASTTATTNGTPTLNEATLKKAISRYYQELKGYEGKAKHELALRTAFQNMLSALAHNLGWTLIPEQTLEDGLRPDGVLRDAIGLRRGYWEAKGPGSNLEHEIEQKIRKGYPLTNTVFENTKIAVLFQGKRRVLTCDLQRSDQLQQLLRSFLTYTEPHIEKFQKAVLEFKESLPSLAHDLVLIIQAEHKSNPRFKTAFATFAALCREALDPNLSDAAIDEMLAQHLLTERIFRTVFNNPDFVNRNVIAAEIEKVIQALTSRSFNREDFLESLDRYYNAIEETARGIRSWTERQEFLNTVYEGFFQGFSVKQADVHGIVYTPPEIVDFMCKSVDVVLQREFGKRIATPGVKILDPCVGTGSFIVNLMQPMTPDQLEAKYNSDLFCNEITLLPYYIASLNIEHEYYVKTRHYKPFEGICFVDTLTLEGAQKELPMFSERNTERILREREAEIMVVIGNPPYNAWQRNENDNNKNRKYKAVDDRIRETYVKDSKASNKNALSDVYVKFFRWATDRLGGRDGVICFVSNNGFLDGVAFDGFRKALLNDFNLIYHLDFKGNARTSGERRRAEGGNIFDDKIRTGIGITLLIRAKHLKERKVFYHCVGDYWSAQQKREYLHSCKDLNGVSWQSLIVDTDHNWLVEDLPTDFSNYLPLGTKEGRSERLADVTTIFKNYGRGVATCRDDWAYDFDRAKLIAKIKSFIGTYNSEVGRWQGRDDDKTPVDDFVNYDDKRIKWSEGLKSALQRGVYASFKEAKIRKALYRPFCGQWLFFDYIPGEHNHILNERIYQLPQIFPTPVTEAENVVICLSGIGSNKSFHCLATNIIPDLHLTGDSQCFPYYVYSEDGSNRRENITDWALRQFQERYGPDVTKWDIFHYVYAMLHHPQYRQRYAENLKRDLPHIPLVRERAAFDACVRIGDALMRTHLDYEKAELFGELAWSDGPDDPWYVNKMRLTPDRGTVIINRRLSLPNIPPECFTYRLGNRSALEWIIDQYQVSTDKRSGIVSNPNRSDDEQYIARLVQRIVTVSVETVRLVSELERTVSAEDWV